jgi:hypothetical protein
MDNTVVAYIKVGKYAYTTLLWYTGHTYACDTGIGIDEISSDLKIPQYSESVALPKIGKGR